MVGTSGLYQEVWSRMEPEVELDCFNIIKDFLTIYDLVIMIILTIFGRLK